MTKDQFKSEVISKLVGLLDSNSLEYVKNVLTESLVNVEFDETRLPDTIENNNEYYLNMFFSLQSSRLSKRTLEVYAMTLKNFLLVVNKPLTSVQGIDIEYFLTVKRKTCSEVSLNNHKRNLSAFFTWMRKKHFITENPCDDVESYKEVAKPIDHLEVTESEELKNGCRNTRDRALFEFFRCTGVRVGELVTVKISDVDFAEGEVLIYAHKTKTTRNVYLDKIAIGYIKTYVEERDLPLNSDYPLFSHANDNSKALTESGIRKILTCWKKNTTLSRKVYPHLFRKTVATNMVRHGATMSETGHYLGHKDRSVTGMHYAYIDASQSKNTFYKYLAIV